MSKKSLFYLLFFSGLILLFILAMQPFLILHFERYISVLFPKGAIGIKQRNLLFIIQVVMLLVVIPVYILTFIFCWRYRAQNTKATYDPDLVDHRIAEYIWWGVPILMILFISALTWVRTFELDPYKPLASDRKALEIQVVALQWKWLFIYPEEKIATVNFLQIPTNTPIHFSITADAPMNSLWIPRLGGQIYAMPSMRTELNLIADAEGDFRGSSANISGEGFAGMHFVTRASSEEDYLTWVESVKKSTEELNWQGYVQLAKPSQNNPVALFQLKDDALFDQIIMKYMVPAADEKYVR